jgi:hypothetical protein
MAVAVAAPEVERLGTAAPVAWSRVAPRVVSVVAVPALE